MASSDFTPIAATLLGNNGLTGLQPLSLSRFLPTFCLLILLAAAPTSHAQGCAQCRDNTAATPPSTQRAYRHAIALLALTASGIFAGTVLLLRRHQ